MIRINVGGREYGSWDELPEDVRAQLLAAGVDPGPDGRLDSLDLSRASSASSAGGAVTRRTVVTGPGGAPLPPVVSQVLTSIADALGSALRSEPAAAVRTQPEGSAPPPVAPEVAADADRDTDRDADLPGDRHHDDPETEPDVGFVDPVRSRRVPLALGWIIIAGTVLLVATVVVIGLSGV